MRQAVLEGFDPANAQHAGLAIDRLLRVKKLRNETEQRSDLLAVVSIRSEGAAYAAAFKRWQAALAEVPHMQATTRGPLAIGLGNASPYEVGLTLHHTYGVPYLPASALKGLARRVALELHARDELSGEDIKVLFGDTDSAGYITFWDGWLEPQQGPTLQLDTITVHHPEYYRSGKKWPTDFDDPTPVPFLSVRAGLRFELRASGPSDWATLALQLLEHGLTHYGLGGKTNAGYGGFNCTEPVRPLSAEEQAEAAAQAQMAEAEALADKIRTELKNAKAFRDSGAKLLAQIAEFPPQLRGPAVAAVQERAKIFGEKKWAKKAKSLLEEA